MGRSCKYCAIDDTSMDRYGYCKKYGCFERSGKAETLRIFINKAREVWTMPDTYGQIGTVVSNPYSTRHRYVQGVIREAEHEFGGCPQAIWDVIPDKYHGPWDKNIRW